MNADYLPNFLDPIAKVWSNSQPFLETPLLLKRKKVSSRVTRAKRKQKAAKI
jgi:hypothetical protein